MRRVVVTGARGFLGSNLCIALKRIPEVQVVEITEETPTDLSEDHLNRSDFVFHLAGVNRPESPEAFYKGNVQFTEWVLDRLRQTKRPVPVLISSSTQVELENPYGDSKRLAENAIFAYSQETGSPCFIYRLANIFGKWSRPNYNSVVATFCYNVSRGIPIQISDPQREIEFVHVDDVVSSFIATLTQTDGRTGVCSVEATYKVTLADLAAHIISFNEIRQTKLIPNLEDRFVRLLYSTYLSYLDERSFSYPVELKMDSRGWLFELLKSRSFGQIFVSKTRPGITRGNHFHDSKVEKFCVIEGQGVIRFRKVSDETVLTYPVSDDPIQIVDIPPGYTHSIENVGQMDMIVLFWTSEVFDPNRMDTYFEEVLPCPHA